MKQNKKKNARSLALMVLVFIFSMSSVSNHPVGTISILLFLIVIACIAGAVIYAKRQEKAVRENPLCPSAPRQQKAERRSRGSSAQPRAATMKTEKEDYVRAQDFSDRSEDQWKSLYEAGLIDKAEYQEKVRRAAGRG